MKVLISIFIGLLVVGCGKNKQPTNTNESNNTPVKTAKKKAEKETPSKGDDKNSTAPKPVKELTLREKVVGTYESMHPKGAYSIALLETGIMKMYQNGRQIEEEDSWKISTDGEAHIDHQDGFTSIWKINPDSSLTGYAEIRDGKRKEVAKEK